MVRLPVFSWQVLELNTLNTRRFLLRLPELLSRWRRERTFPIYRLNRSSPTIATERRPRVAQLKQRLRQLRQKSAWSLNFAVNAFDFIGGKGGGVYLAQSWQGTLHADLRWSEELE